jgi:hypothetical protein
MRRSTLVCLLLLAAQLAFSQAHQVEQFLQFSKDYELGERWSVDLRSELRLSWYETGEAAGLDWTQLYIQAGSAYTLSPNWIVGGAYRLSRRGALDQPSDTEHRFAQLVAATQRFSKFRIREQLKLEQRVFSDETVHRWRFRAALDFPLSGEQLDINEWYLNQQATLLLEPFEQQAWAGREYRLYLGSGTLRPNKSRLEIGIEARWARSAVDGTYETRWILRSTWSF